MQVMLANLPRNRDRARYEEAPMHVVAVADLPWPHHPSRCEHAEAFRAHVPEHTSYAASRQHVERVARSFTPPQLAACWYHGPNWSWATEAAIAFFEHGVEPGPGECVDAARADGASVEDAEALLALFVEPIFVAGEELGNGQHRVCAMKLGGVERCLIET